VSAQSRDFRGVIRPVGAVILGIGVMIALCATVGMVWDQVAPDPRRPQGGVAAMVLSAIIVSTIGLGAFLYGSRFVSERISRREALLGLGLRDRRFGWPLEMVLRAADAGWRIEEVPVSYRKRAGRSKVTGTVRGTARTIADMTRAMR